MNLWIKEMFGDEALREKLLNEIVGQIDEISSFDDEECMRREKECDQLEKEMKKKNIFK